MVLVEGSINPHHKGFEFLRRWYCKISLRAQFPMSSRKPYKAESTANYENTRTIESQTFNDDALFVFAANIDSQTSKGEKHQNLI